MFNINWATGISLTYFIKLVIIVLCLQFEGEFRGGGCIFLNHSHAAKTANYSYDQTIVQSLDEF